MKKIVGSIISISLIFSVAWAGKKQGAIRAVADTKNCDAFRGQAKFEGTFCETLRYIQPKLVPLRAPSQIFAEAQVILLGDTHPNVLIKKWLSRNLSEMKAMGFTHVALEALNSESQNILDGYGKGSVSRAQLVSLVAADWGWIPEEHVKMIDTILAAGLKVVAIDNRNELDRAGYGNDIQRRNDHMSMQLESVLSHPDAGRIVVLTGKLHSALVSEETGIATIPQILEAHGISNLTYDIESTEEFAPKNLIQAFIEELKSNKLAPSTSGDYFLPTPVADSAVHGVVFVSK
ncbi:hypothetical protein AZI86_14640 [Bdellovibrio bacteriovorus]|uniref:Haem-binding uptake Tiki superfamily ChaN domain-containing protein n=1 Tax=Bdellovibrio bacteriovorus TaxID=959 RepID=A0A150WK19_BDEBC|nr:ChaN family lipoprotein [Bdellovibrio bacteriovorus]KYG64040.1 hypothetical protein AZI86_14640 [Bdellovibrio bacteriovorus]